MLEHKYRRKEELKMEHDRLKKEHSVNTVKVTKLKVLKSEHDK